MKKYVLFALSNIAMLGINVHSKASDLTDERNDKSGRTTPNVTTANPMQPDQNVCRYPYVPRERVFVGIKGDLPMFREKYPKDTTFMQRFWKVVDTYKNPDNSQ